MEYSEEDRKRLGELLAARRRSLGFRSRDALARSVGFKTASSFALLESGKSVPSMAKAVRQVERAYQLPVGELDRILRGVPTIDVPDAFRSRAYVHVAKSQLNSVLSALDVAVAKVNGGYQGELERALEDLRLELGASSSDEEEDVVGELPSRTPEPLPEALAGVLAVGLVTRTQLQDIGVKRGGLSGTLAHSDVADVALDVVAERTEQLIEKLRAGEPIGLALEAQRLDLYATEQVMQLTSPVRRAHLHTYRLHALQRIRDYLSVNHDGMYPVPAQYAGDIESLAILDVPLLERVDAYDTALNHLIASDLTDYRRNALSQRLAQALRADMEAAIGVDARLAARLREFGQLVSDLQPRTLLRIHSQVYDCSSVWLPRSFELRRRLTRSA